MKGNVWYVNSKQSKEIGFNWMCVWISRMRFFFIRMIDRNRWTILCRHIFLMQPHQTWIHLFNILIASTIGNFHQLFNTLNCIRFFLGDFKLPRNMLLWQSIVHVAHNSTSVSIWLVFYSILVNLQWVCHLIDCLTFNNARNP